MAPDFDPHKTLRDLQSALERESDLREQLKFAEEESGTLRQKVLVKIIYNNITCIYFTGMNFLIH
jgi:hypothetical protein